MAELISIVIPCDGRSSLNETLASITASRDAPLYETIVVGLLPDPPSAIPPTYFIPSTGLGTGAMRNMGVHHAKGDIILFVDSDCIVDPDWLANAAKACTPEHAVIAGGIRFPENNIWDCGDNLAIFHAVHVSQRKGPVRGRVGTNNLVVRRDVFQKVGGFDIGLTVGEDEDFLTRAKKNGYTVYFDPAFAVLHQSNRTDEGKVRQHAIWYAQGYVRLLEEAVFTKSKFRADSVLLRYPRLQKVWSAGRAALAVASIVAFHPPFWRYYKSYKAAWLFLYTRRLEVFRLFAHPEDRPGG